MSSILYDYLKQKYGKLYISPISSPFFSIILLTLIANIHSIFLFKMNRRSFLQKSAAIAGAVCLDFPAFAEKVKTFGEPKLKIGILSAINIKKKEENTSFA